MLITEKIENVLTPIANEHSLRIVQISYSHKTLQVLVEKDDYSSPTISECEKASKGFAAILDVEDLISEKYFLEVSSAGLARPLITIDDYKHFTGRDIKLELKMPRNFEDTRKSFKGKIENVNQNIITLETTLDNQLQKIDLEFDNILKSKLLITDDFIKQLLKDEKKERKNQNV